MLVHQMLLGYCWFRINLTSPHKEDEFQLLLRYSYEDKDEGVGDVLFGRYEDIMGLQTVDVDSSD